MAQPKDRPRHHNFLLGLAITLAVLVLTIAFALHPIARYETRQALNKLDGFTGDFDDARVSVFPLRYKITKLKLQSDDAPKGAPPLFYTTEAEAGLSWGALIRGRLVADVKVFEPKISILSTGAPSKGAKPPPDLGAELRKATPIEVDRVEVKDGQLLFVMENEPKHPEIWLNHVELTLENFATRKRLMKRPTTLALSGTLQRSGKLSVFATANPLEKSPTFAGQAKLEGLQLSELAKFLEDKAQMEPTKGTVDLLARFEAKEGRIRGGVKPVLKNPGVKSASPNLFDKLKAGLADTGLKIFSDRVPGRNAVVAVIPIEGRLDKPDIQVWPTILGVVRNAFVQGVTESFRNLPPPQAPKKEGPLAQARRALSKSGTVPRAQPQKNEEKSK